MGMVDQACADEPLLRRQWNPQADYNGVQYLYKSKKYDPVGLYSVAMGMMQMEHCAPESELRLSERPPGLGRTA